MRGEAANTGLLIDFGGVLTTSVWDSFADFCREKKLEEDAVKRLFREDPEALACSPGLTVRVCKKGRAIVMSNSAPNCITPVDGIDLAKQF